jgi:hypothetical protein
VSQKATHGPPVEVMPSDTKDSVRANQPQDFKQSMAVTQ